MYICVRVCVCVRGCSIHIREGLTQGVFVLEKGVFALEKGSFER